MIWTQILPLLFVDFIRNFEYNCGECKEVTIMSVSTQAKPQATLTEGRLLPKIILFVLPLMITNLLQVLYSAADMIVVGMSNVEGAIGAIGTTTAMINLIINIFMGFSVGTNVVVARSIGSRDRDAAEKAIHTSLLLSLILGGVCAGIGLFISRPILALLGDEGHVLDLASLYTQIYFAGVPFIAATNYLIAIFRAKGDTRTPLIVLTASGLCNVGLNLFFVLVCKMSVDGVSLATVIANAVSAVVLTCVLMRDPGYCHFSFRKLGIDRLALRDIIRIGLPAGIQGALFSLSNMLIQSSIIKINNTVCPGGSDIIDGNAAGNSLENFVYTSTNSVYQASVTFTSQHYGAGKIKRIGKVMLDCYLVTTVIALIGMTVLIGWRVPLAKLYVDAPLAIETACTRILWIITSYFLLAWMETGSGVLRGLGKSTTSTIVSLLGSCVLRVIWIATAFHFFPRLEIVYISYPISWAITAAAHFCCSMIVRSRYMKKYPEAEETA